MELINDLLDCAKAGSGMINLVPETVALPELFQQCIAIVEPKSERASVSVTAPNDPALATEPSEKLSDYQAALAAQSEA